MIGVVGGVGPYAGLDLAKNIFDNTIANADQDHLDLVMLSMSNSIIDRTEFLMGRDKNNPAGAIAEVLLKMEEIGATVAGIPCNTAHAPTIFNHICDLLRGSHSGLHLLNMAEETISYIKVKYPAIKKVGVLSTTGTYKFGIYSNPLATAGLEAIIPDFETQDNIVHAAIYNRDYGIKACTNPITDRARKDLLFVANELIEKGAELIIKGCTEIVLAVPEKSIQGVPTIDPSIILARSLITQVAPKKLKSEE